MPGFVLLVRDRADGDPAMRIGYTVSKKVGGAVARNRMKRRLRALARELLPEGGVAGADHVLIGRAGGIERSFDQLRAELVKALRKLVPPPIRAEAVEVLSFPSPPENEGRASTASAPTDPEAGH